MSYSSTALKGERACCCRASRKVTEANDLSWTVDSDGFSIQSFPVNSVINGFFINKTGSYTLIVKCKPQSYFHTGLWIATLSFISVFLLLGSPKLRAFFSGARTIASIISFRSEKENLLLKRTLKPISLQAFARIQRLKLLPSILGGDITNK